VSRSRKNVARPQCHENLRPKTKLFSTKWFLLYSFWLAEQDKLIRRQCAVSGVAALVCVALNLTAELSLKIHAQPQPFVPREVANERPADLPGVS
jgi:hypothetical protein